jgi:uncharacterized protein
MPTLNLDDNQSAYQIRAYQPGSVQINTTIYTHSVIVTPTTLIDHWAPQTLAELDAASLRIILDLKPDLILLGTGSVQVFPPQALYSELINAGIGVEIMDTRAACRTYNALSAENRSVAACLIIR